MRVVSFFAGCGGLDLGFEQAGFDVVWANEFEPHFRATYLRNHPVWKDRVIYWGPMGCLTGNYLLMRGNLKPSDIVELMQRTFRFVANFEGEVPGTTPKDCGNYLLHDLPMARWESAKYLHEVLEQMTEENMNYPQQ